MQHTITIQLVLILISTVLLALAIMLVSVYKRLFSSVRNLWLRRNLVVLSIALLIMTALLLLQSPEAMTKEKAGSFFGLMVKQLGNTALIVCFVFNSVWLVSRIPVVQNMSFLKHHAVIILSIIVSALIIYSLVHYIDNGRKFTNLHGTLVFAYYNALATGLIYTAVNYVELERKRKLKEKELEVTKLMALKTKAELDALHSKVNPHFLYNALNSIADLSITDGRKARRMTIALADLFRYSINYSQNNYSTVNDEVAMTEVYLQIEKIRFEDQLNYTVNVEEGAGHYLLPRFILQPLVENAVKHGLKVTGQMTEIMLSVSRQNDGLLLAVADNGPAFPDDLMPGYGVKSVFDKLDLLFPGMYDIRFSNQPRKEVSIHIHKLMKNEPLV
jgi:two-component system LytT family sensor kinase